MAWVLLKTKQKKHKCIILTNLLTDILLKQWMEKMPSGVFIFRNDRAEDREARKHSNSKHKTMELLISNIQAQFEKEMEGRTLLFFLDFWHTGIYFKLDHRLGCEAS